jgi:hypothetical protein
VRFLAKALNLAGIRQLARWSGRPCGFSNDRRVIREEAFQRLKAKLERGAAQAAGGELLDGDTVFEELPELVCVPRRVKKKASRR